MALLAVQVTESGVNLKLGPLIVWYCIAPHCCGVRLYQPGQPPERGTPPQRILVLDRSRW